MLHVFFSARDVDELTKGCVKGRESMAECIEKMNMLAVLAHEG